MQWSKISTFPTIITAAVVSYLRHESNHLYQSRIPRKWEGHFQSVKCPMSILTIRWHLSRCFKIVVERMHRDKTFRIVTSRCYSISITHKLRLTQIKSMLAKLSNLFNNSLRTSDVPRVNSCLHSWALEVQALLRPTKASSIIKFSEPLIRF